MRRVKKKTILQLSFWSFKSGEERIKTWEVEVGWGRLKNQSRTTKREARLQNIIFHIFFLLQTGDEKYLLCDSCLLTYVCNNFHTYKGFFHQLLFRNQCLTLWQVEWTWPSVTKHNLWLLTLLHRSVAHLCLPARPPAAVLGYFLSFDGLVIDFYHWSSTERFVPW